MAGGELLLQVFRFVIRGIAAISRPAPAEGILQRAEESLDGFTLAVVGLAVGDRDTQASKQPTDGGRVINDAQGPVPVPFGDALESLRGVVVLAGALGRRVRERRNPARRCGRQSESSSWFGSWVKIVQPTDPVAALILPGGKPGTQVGHLAPGVADHHVEAVMIAATNFVAGQRRIVSAQ